MLSVVAVAATAFPQVAQVAQVERVRLKSVPTPSLHRLAPGTRGTLPKRAWRAKLGKVRYVFYDLDGDGVIAPGASDGIALDRSPFVVRLPRTLLLPHGQFSLAFEEEELVMTPDELGLDRKLVRSAAFLTELRINAARTPLTIVPEASRHSEWHLDYLELNGLIGKEVTLDVHREEPNARGYTPEGAKAGRLGIIGFSQSFRADVEDWYATAYHAVTIIDPSLTRIGVARKHGASLLYPLDMDWHGTEPIVHPPPDGIESPVAFSRGGEVPVPVPGTEYGRGCGFPVIVLLPRSIRNGRLLQFQLEDAKGRQVAGYASSPSKPANEEWPDNGGCAFFIPRKPLAFGARYTASLHVEGMKNPLEWSFTTRRSGAKHR